MIVDEYIEAIEMLTAIKNSIKKCGKNTILVGMNAESTEFVIDYAIKAINDELSGYDFGNVDLFK